MDVVAQTANNVLKRMNELSVAMAYISGDSSVGIPGTEMALVVPKTLIQEDPDAREYYRKDISDMIGTWMGGAFVRVVWDDECFGCGRIMEKCEDGVLECKHCKDHED